MKIIMEIDDLYEDDGEGGGLSFRDLMISNIEEHFKNKYDIEKIIQQKINKMLDSRIMDSVIEEISNLSSKLLEDYLDREITVTDDYGREKYKGTLREKIHAAFDEYMKGDVDEDGRPSRSSYGTLYKRSEFIIKKVMDNEMNKFTASTIKKVREEVKSELTDKLKTAVGKGVVDSIGINKLIENIQQ